MDQDTNALLKSILNFYSPPQSTPKISSNPTSTIEQLICARAVSIANTVPFITLENRKAQEGMAGIIGLTLEEAESGRRNCLRYVQQYLERGMIASEEEYHTTMAKRKSKTNALAKFIAAREFKKRKQLAMAALQSQRQAHKASKVVKQYHHQKLAESSALSMQHDMTAQERQRLAQHVGGIVDYQSQQMAWIIQEKQAQDAAMAEHKRETVIWAAKQYGNLDSVSEIGAK